MGSLRSDRQFYVHMLINQNKMKLLRLRFFFFEKLFLADGKKFIDKATLDEAEKWRREFNKLLNKNEGKRKVKLMQCQGESFISEFCGARDVCRKN